MKRSKVRYCPFCGSTNIEVLYGWGMIYSIETWQWICKDCKMRGIVESFGRWDLEVGKPRKRRMKKKTRSKTMKEVTLRSSTSVSQGNDEIHNQDVSHPVEGLE